VSSNINHLFTLFPCAFISTDIVDGDSRMFSLRKLAHENGQGVSSSTYGGILCKAFCGTESQRHSKDTKFSRALARMRNGDIVPLKCQYNDESKKSTLDSMKSTLYSPARGRGRPCSEGHTEADVDLHGARGPEIPIDTPIHEELAICWLLLRMS